MRTSNLIRVLFFLLTLSCFAGLAYAQDATTRRSWSGDRDRRALVAEPPAIDAGNTAWMLTSTALVADDGHSRPGTLLRGHGAQEERALGR